MKNEDYKKILLHKHKERKLTGEDFLSTGSTVLNCACTDNPNRGFIKGHYYHIVGDSISGKTWLSLTCLAEAALNPNFDNHRFIYDNGEGGALMNIEKYFGKAVAERIEPPAGTRSKPKYARLLEEFYYYLADAFETGKPFIYIKDSLDVSTSLADQELFKENKKLFEKGRETKNTYGMSKAKINSEYMKNVVSELGHEGQSIVIGISQSRDNIGGFEKTNAGGHALKFYATLQLWSSVKEKLKKTVLGKPRQTGILCQIKVKKNRVTGKERVVTIPIYHSFGIDDIGSCVSYLIDEGHWPEKSGIITASEMNFEGKFEKFVRHIEREELEKDLRNIVGDVWNEIEEASVMNRKKRYE